MAVKVLLAYGAKAHIKDNQDKTALDYAQKNNDTQAAALLSNVVIANHTEKGK